MPFKIANHGGRYLYVDPNNELKADNNYDLSRTPDNLAAKGDTFDVDENNRIVVNNEPVTLTEKVTGKERPTKFDLMLEQLNPEEYVIRTADRRKNHRYVFSGLDKLRVQDEPNAMAMFSVVQEEGHANHSTPQSNKQQQQQHQQDSQHPHQECQQQDPSAPQQFQQVPHMPHLF
ncbi:hypothetical protein BDB00DRAFT_132257 [Zychaea mexicana]|uniref:uncharacterized protein n=1 Tax=Zychaea mexicana TaxID=64656 RepID=UPI0022FE45F2|nr:uncharacterized protein BDB00DRAFT_132257 [Zychaea mexicana]KAI9484509.1 hypothetical protein BDB00DRAFT_132257 [Zychaea mexicana]